MPQSKCITEDPCIFNCHTHVQKSRYMSSWIVQWFPKYSNAFWNMFIMSILKWKLACPNALLDLLSTIDGTMYFPINLSFSSHPTTTECAAFTFNSVITWFCIFYAINSTCCFCCAFICFFFLLNVNVCSIFKSKSSHLELHMLDPENKIKLCNIFLI